MDGLLLFKNLSGTGSSASSRPSLSLSPEIYQTPIERLELSHRTLNCLKRAHITRVGEVLEMSDDELLKIRNFGEKSLSELRTRLAEQGVGPSDASADAGLAPGGAGLLAQLGEEIGDRGMEGIALISSPQAEDGLLGGLAVADAPEDAEESEDDLDYDFDDEEDC